MLGRSEQQSFSYLATYRSQNSFELFTSYVTSTERRERERERAINIPCVAARSLARSHIVSWVDSFIRLSTRCQRWVMRSACESLRTAPIQRQAGRQAGSQPARPPAWQQTGLPARSPARPRTHQSDTVRREICGSPTNGVLITSSAANDRLIWS